MKEYTLGLYEKSMPSSLSWEERLMEAKRAGFDFLEISIDETEERLSRLNMGREERQGILRAMDQAGLPIRTMCLSGHRRYPLGSLDAQVRGRAMEIMEQALGLADSLGIRIIQLAGYDVYYEEGNGDTRRYFEENLRRAVDMAACRGILMGFETMETEFMNTVEKAMEYVAKMDSPYLGVYPDLGNITNAALLYGTDVSGDLRKGRGKLVAMHLKETKPGIFREVPFGEGHVDFETGIHTAWECGVRRFVTEFWYTGNPGWRDDLDGAALRMRGILDRGLETR